MRCLGPPVDAEGIQALTAVTIMEMVHMAGIPGILL
jgi:hypothetical protein